jgi:hypothetical protein
VSPQPGSLYTPGASGARQRFERASAKPLLFLQQLRWVTPVVLAVLLVLGLAAPGWPGALALLVLAGFLAWMCALSWPALGGRARLLRLASVACVLVVAVIQALR